MMTGRLIVMIVAPLLVLGTAAGGVWLLYATKPEPDKQDDGPRPISVFVHEAQPQTVRLKIRTAGEVRARTTVDLTAQVSGRVVSVSPEFTEGGRFSPGETLVWVEPADYELALAQAEAEVAAADLGVQQALADADVARKQLRRAEDPTPLALRKPQVAEARARLTAAKANRRQAELNLTRTRLALPFAGRVTSKVVDVGQFVNPGTVLGSAFATDTVEVRVPLTDEELASLGLPIGYVAGADEGPPVRFAAQLAGTTHTWVGRLARIDAAVDPASRVIFALAELDAPYGANVSEAGMPMAVGLYVDVELASANLREVVVIPRDALRAGDKVYVINSADRLEIRGVAVAHSSPESAFIEEGLRLGDRVVLSSIHNAVPGMALSAMPGDSDARAVVADRDQRATAYNYN